MITESSVKTNKCGTKHFSSFLFRPGKDCFFKNLFKMKSYDPNTCARLVFEITNLLCMISPEIDARGQKWLKLLCSDGWLEAVVAKKERKRGLAENFLPHQQSIHETKLSKYIDQESHHYLRELNVSVFKYGNHLLMCYRVVIMRQYKLKPTKVI